MKIAILGAGALGSVIGGLLVLAGRAVELWDVNDAHVNAINANGLKLDRPNRQDSIPIEARHPEHAGDADVIILLTKAMHSEAAIASVKQQIERGAHVLTLQNGLGNAERLARIMLADQVLYGCTMMPGRFIAPGHVSTEANGSAVFRALTGAGDAVGQALAMAEEDIVLRFEPAEADRTVWQKAAFNCAMNTICALQGGTVGKLAAYAPGVELARAIAAEVVDVANAAGIEADRAAVFAQMDHALAHHRAHKPSMLQDIEAARATEIDSLCGEVSRKGSELGVPTPLNRALATLITLKTRCRMDDDR